MILSMPVLVHVARRTDMYSEALLEGCYLSNLERQTSPKPSDCITFIPGIDCLNSVTITSGVCSVNHPLGEITSLCIFILFAILLRF